MTPWAMHALTWAALQGRRARLPHALLLVGPRGIGKYDLARAWVASLLCESPGPDGLACHRCAPCNWFAQANHPDFRLLRPEYLLLDTVDGEETKKKPSQVITIDQVRDLEDFLRVGTHRAGLRIVLIEPAEAMNVSTANALLKSLEEPAPQTLFVLVSSEPLRLLPTIRSRCQVLPFTLPEPSVAEAALRAAGVDAPERWLAFCGGAPGDAIAMAQSDSGWVNELEKILLAGKALDPFSAAALFDQRIKAGKGAFLLKQVVDALHKWLVDLELACHQLPPRYFVHQASALQSLARSIQQPPNVLHAYRAVAAQRREAEHPLNARLFLENLFLAHRHVYAATIRAYAAAGRI